MGLEGGVSVEVKWSNTLRTTAGITRLYQSRGGAGRKWAVVELASKVVDDEQRLKETYVTSNQSAALSSGSRLQICLLDASLAVWRSIS